MGNSEEELFSEDSDKDYVPSGFSEDSESDTVSSELECPKPLSNADCPESVLVKDTLPEDAVCIAQLKKSCRKVEQVFEVYNKEGVENIEAEDTTECGEGPSVPSSEISTSSVDQEQPGRNKVLALATMSDSVLCQQTSPSVWKLLTPMKDDDISAAVRSDFTILQLAQSFLNKHGQDPSKYDYIRQKLREVGRLLLILRKQFPLHTIEDAVKPANFGIVIQAVKRVSGYDAAKHTYHTPSLALKLGHSLNKLCDIIHCRALMAEDDARIKSSQTFKKLYNSKWSELVSHGALTTLHEGHFNKPSTLPFTEDVQRLHQHLETVADLASDNLKKTASTKVQIDSCQNYSVQ
ncbi:unnamed protein product [Leuciscus chuanchicus]